MSCSISQARAQAGLRQHLVQLGRIGLRQQHALERRHFRAFLVGVELARNDVGKSDRLGRRRVALLALGGAARTVEVVFLLVRLFLFVVLIRIGRAHLGVAWSGADCSSTTAAFGSSGGTASSAAASLDTSAAASAGAGGACAGPRKRLRLREQQLHLPVVPAHRPRAPRKQVRPAAWLRHQDLWGSWSGSGRDSGGVGLIGRCICIRVDGRGG